MMCKLALILFVENSDILPVSSAFVKIFQLCWGVWWGETTETIKCKVINCLHTYIHLMIELKTNLTCLEIWPGTLRYCHFDQCFIIIQSKIWLQRCLYQVISKFLYILFKIKLDFHMILRCHKNTQSHNMNGVTDSSLGSSSLSTHQQLNCKVVFSSSTHTVVICINELSSFIWIRWII